MTMYPFGLSEEEAAELEAVMSRMGELAEGPDWSTKSAEFVELQGRLNQLVPPGTMP